jgi:hypothetical protein
MAGENVLHGVELGPLEPRILAAHCQDYELEMSMNTAKVVGCWHWRRQKMTNVRYCDRITGLAMKGREVESCMSVE